jgi:hypothetical protein
VFVGVKLGRFNRVMRGVVTVPARNVGVMTGLLVISAFVLRGSFTMVSCRVLVMFSRLSVVLCACMWHFSYLSMRVSPDASGLSEPKNTSFRASF